MYDFPLSSNYRSIFYYNYKFKAGGYTFPPNEFHSSNQSIDLTSMNHIMQTKKIRQKRNGYRDPFKRVGIIVDFKELAKRCGKRKEIRIIPSK
ncbi:MAG: hypothetical protein C4527_16685 [Candidatus Omnitrophota bacterium]|nr:MAG: hypothetical protein C4527_16685 [Candidatus Omnitrophota bacterium]